MFGERPIKPIKLDKNGDRMEAPPAYQESAPQNNSSQPQTAEMGGIGQKGSVNKAYSGETTTL